MRRRILSLVALTFVALLLIAPPGGRAGGNGGDDADQQDADDLEKHHDYPPDPNFLGQIVRPSQLNHLKTYQRSKFYEIQLPDGTYPTNPYLAVLRGHIPHIFSFCPQSAIHRTFSIFFSQAPTMKWVEHSVSSSAAI